MRLEYPARFKRGEDGRVFVKFIDFGEPATDGANWDEAWQEAQDCLGSVIAFAIRDRRYLPSPNSLPGTVAVPVPDWISEEAVRYLTTQEVNGSAP